MNQMEMWDKENAKDEMVNKKWFWEQLLLSLPRRVCDKN